MTIINDVLTSIGLTKTEAIVYLCGLSYSAISVNELEKQTNIKRTTIYHALDTLMSKGLVAKKGTQTRLKFTMVKPDNLEKLIDQKIALLKEQKGLVNEILPMLQQKVQAKESTFLVSHFEGIAGIKMAVEMALYCKSEHWDIIAPSKNFFSEFDQGYARYFIETRRRKNIITRSLWEETPNRRLLTPLEIKQRNPRYLPKAMHGKFKSVIILFDDKVLIVSSLKELSAILIQSIEIHQTMTAIFETLYLISEKYKKNIT